MSSKRKNNNRKVVVLTERSLEARPQRTQPSANPGRAQRKKRVNKSRKTGRLRRSGQLPMKPCTLHYMQAILDPFSYRLTGKEVCIPDLWDIPSFKFSTRLRGTFQTSSVSSAGGIVLSPFTYATNNFCLWATNPSYTNAYIPEPGDIGSFGVFDTNFPFPANQTRNVRLVAAGIRVRYIGTQLNMGGQILPIALCGQFDRVCGLDASEISQQNNTIQFPGSRAWHGCCFRPTHPDQMTYTTTTLPFTVNADAVNGKMGVLVISPIPNQVYEYEVVRFFEALSNSSGGLVNSVPSTTMSDSDISGMSTVRQFIGSVSNSEVGQSLWSKGSTFLAKIAADTALNYAGLPSLTYGPSVIEL